MWTNLNWNDSSTHPEKGSEFKLAEVDVKGGIDNLSGTFIFYGDSIVHEGGYPSIVEDDGFNDESYVAPDYYWCYAPVFAGDVND